jgi:hypothetical protein
MLLAMAFKLLSSGEERCRKVNAPHLVGLVKAGFRFPNGKGRDAAGEYLSWFSREGWS